MIVSGTVPATGVIDVAAEPPVHLIGAEPARQAVVVAPPPVSYRCPAAPAKHPSPPAEQHIVARIAFEVVPPP